jgi:hypothetical protein
MSGGKLFGGLFLFRVLWCERFVVKQMNRIMYKLHKERNLKKKHFLSLRLVVR